jgi:hypothetical protein
MNETANPSSPRRNPILVLGLRIYGILAIAFGVLSLSGLTVKFPPSPRFAGGIYLGIVIGILGVPVFLLRRWAVVIFVVVCTAFGVILVYAFTTQQAPEWDVSAWAAALLVVAPIALLWSCWSSLR